MEWSDVDAALSAFATLSTSVAAIVVASVAVIGYRKWHAESIGNRKIELAEDIVAGFYEARNDIRDMRGAAKIYSSRLEMNHPGSSIDEIAREGIDVLNAKAEFFARLQAKQYRAMAYFGKEAAKPFQDLEVIHGYVRRDAVQMIRAYHKDGPSAEVEDEWKLTLGLYVYSPDKDEYRKKIDGIISAVEDSYGRWLMRERGSTGS